MNLRVSEEELASLQMTLNLLKQEPWENSKESSINELSQEQRALVQYMLLAREMEHQYMLDLMTRSVISLIILAVWLPHVH
jgi:hypothetical protein